MRARCRRSGTSTPAWRSAARRRGRAGFASREVPRCRSGDRATSSGARRARGASRALECPLCDAAQLYGPSDGGPTASQRGPNYAGQYEQDGCQGQAEAHADRLSKLVRLEFRPLSRGRHVARCTPVPGERRALLDIGPQGRSLVGGLVSQHPPAGAVKGLGDQGGLHQESRRVARDRTTSGGCRDEPAPGRRPMSDYDPPSLDEAARPGLGIEPSPGPGLEISALQCGCDW